MSGAAGQGAGLFSETGPAVLRNTLVAGNRHASGSASGRDDVSGALDPGSDYNLVGDGTGLSGIADGVNGNRVGSAASPVDPRLGPLQDNGGPTQTHALLPGSPALDAGSNAYATEFDQRGVGFPRVANGTIDVGAFEYQAVVFHVTSLGDSGAGSGASGDLRYCLTQANLNPGRDLVTFDVTGTITLTAGLPALTDDVDVQGPGAGLLTVSGNHAVRPFTVAPQVTARICGLTVADGVGQLDEGFTSMQGGGVFNRGVLTLAGCTLTDNVASIGGGAANQGVLALRDCTLSGNSSAGDGGAISYAGDYGGALRVDDCALTDNQSPGRGGASAVGSRTDGRPAQAEVSGSSLWGNSAGDGGALSVAGGAVTVRGCSVGGNGASGSGGGVAVTAGSSYLGTVIPSSLAVVDSTVAGNSAGGLGGGVSAGDGGPDVTVTDNEAGVLGGGGHGGGLDVRSGAVELHDALAAGNFAGADAGARDDVFGALSPGSDYNLVGDGTGMTGLADGVNGNQVGTADAPIEAALGPLQDNGGPALTHALLRDSPARGAGSTAYAAATDQRGLPRVVDGRIDVGAYQTQEGER
jgi:hypothetical protein